MRYFRKLLEKSIISTKTFIDFTCRCQWSRHNYRLQLFHLLKVTKRHISIALMLWFPVYAVIMTFSCKECFQFALKQLFKQIRLNCNEIEFQAESLFVTIQITNILLIYDEIIVSWQTTKRNKNEKKNAEKDNAKVLSINLSSY